MIERLALATLMVGLTVTIHFFGLLALLWMLRARARGANGLLLFGWSTAFLFSVISRMRTLEHDWLERR